MQSNFDRLPTIPEENEAIELMHVDSNSTQVDPKQLESERASEVVFQLFLTSIEAAFVAFPNVSSETFAGAVSEINKFLSYHHIYDESEMNDFLCYNVTRLLENFNWSQEVSKWLKLRWSDIVNDIMNNKPSTYYPAIEQLTQAGFSGIKNLFGNLLDSIQKTPLKNCRFSPKISDWEGFFQQKTQELKQNTKKLKVQLKLNPGVEPPQIKRVTREYYKTVRRPYTEWNTFIHEEEFEVDVQPSCVMVPMIHRICSPFTETKREVVTYYAPAGWEVTRVGANVMDGHFKTANVRRVGFRENRAMAEIEVVFPRLIKDRVWCKVQIEGVMSRKRIQDVQVGEVKSVFVIVDDYGEHELPQGFLEDDLEV